MMDKIIKTDHKQAFTLLEIGIVLVIIGLITGGILAGQTLIKSASVSKYIKLVGEYDTALMAFRDKYFALPGDMPNTLSFWPQCVNGATAPCNGNGDGKIQFETESSTVINEPTRVFEHLSYAGLVTGKYDGSNPFSPDWVPPHRFFGRISIHYVVDDSMYADKFTTNATVFTNTEASEANTEDFYAFDAKIDDGNGLMGKFRIMYDELPSPGCIDTGTGIYQMTAPSDYCTIYILPR